MIRAAIDNVSKLRKNGAMNLLLHPKVIQNYNLYRKELKERPTVMKSQPYGIEIEMTNRCNLACVQCLRSLGLKPYELGEMDPDHYKRILAQFPYAMNIALNGFGEPMMYQSFFDVVAYTRKQRPWAKITIYSNGGLLDEATSYRMMDCGLTEINISIDAAKPETYSRVRRGGNLEVLHGNIRRFLLIRNERRARFPLIGLNYVMVNENEGELVAFCEQAAEFGVDHINCISWAGYDWGFRNRRTRDSYLRELEAAKQRIDELGIECRSFPEISTRWTEPNKRFNCGFFWGEEFRVTYDGHITLGCCTPFKEQYSYGNLLEHDFLDIWNNEVFQRNREMATKNLPPNRLCDSCHRFGTTFFQQPLAMASGAGNLPAGT